MRIVGGRDYYDSALAYGQDREVAHTNDYKELKPSFIWNFGAFEEFLASCGRRLDTETSWRQAMPPDKAAREWFADRGSVAQRNDN
jgi:hypothetical protein